MFAFVENIKSLLRTFQEFHNPLELCNVGVRSGSCCVPDLITGYTERKQPRVLFKDDRFVRLTFEPLEQLIIRECRAILRVIVVEIVELFYLIFCECSCFGMFQSPWSNVNADKSQRRNEEPRNWLHFPQLNTNVVFLEAQVLWSSFNQIMDIYLQNRHPSFITKSLLSTKKPLIIHQSDVLTSTLR